jgi:ribonucleotide reductase class II
MSYTKSSQLISNLIHYSKYARYLPEQSRRETYDETVLRNYLMHSNKYPKLSGIIEESFAPVFRKEILPSMRAFQFAGKAIERNNARLFNCSYLPINHPSSFREILFLLLSGSGVGYSVQTHHIEQLPSICRPDGKMRYNISDNIEGWADAASALIKAFLYGKPEPEYDYSDIRPKGTLLKTSGGRAPGHEELKKSLEKVREILASKPVGSRLAAIECHDIICHLADAVISGGIRRSALISLFSHDDYHMLNAKSGNWFMENPQRARANNSAVAYRHVFTEQDFYKLWEQIATNQSGDPGFVWAYDRDTGYNPCVTKDTWVMTSKGPKQVEELIDTPFTAIVDGKPFKTSEKGFWKTGDKEVYKVTLENGMTLKLTDNHQLYKKDEGWFELKDLNVGDSIRLSEHSEFDSWKGDRGNTLGGGYVLGCMKSKPSFYDEKLRSVHESDQGVEESIEKSSSQFYLGFLSAVMDACGVFDESKFRIERSGEIDLDVIQRMFVRLGVLVEIKDECISIESSHLHRFISKLDKQKPLNTAIMAAKARSFLELRSGREDEETDFSSPIASITKIGVQEVYDVTVPGPHAFCANGIYAHNCVEANLDPNTFCNLVEINAATIFTQEQFNYRARMASRIATLQASWTDFHYLRPIWKEATERDALIGVSMTGIVEGNVMNLDIREAALIVREENEKMAKLLGINKAARTTMIKPAGSTSLLLGGVSNGVHAAHNDYYIKRFTVNHEEPIYKYIKEHMPNVLEASMEKGKENLESFVMVPLKAADGAPLRDEGPMEQLERVRKIYRDWIVPGHRRGSNTNNVSTTVNVKDNEWDEVGKWLFDNKMDYQAVAVFPYYNSDHPQLPLQDITKEEYERRLEMFEDVYFSKIKEDEDNTDLQGELACAGGACAI